MTPTPCIAVEGSLGSCEKGLEMGVHSAWSLHVDLMPCAQRRYRCKSVAGGGEAGIQSYLGACG
jgi:hypothetical protein